MRGCVRVGKALAYRIEEKFPNSREAAKSEVDLRAET